jgi:hypothetical protein
LDGNTADVGGGIYAGNGASLNLLNTTMSGNAVLTNGGAIFTRTVVDIANSTIAYNGGLAGGGIYISGAGDASLKNTILASNTGGNTNGALISLGNNIDSQNTAGFSGPGDQINTDPLLGTLGYYGGPTKTHALLAGSPAIDAGDNSGAPAEDQRGYIRPADGDGDSVAVVDVGAYEVASGNDPGAVSIDNLSPVQGETLTASVSDADGASGAISYQWYRDGLAIGGATGASYTTVAADVGAVLTVRADYTDDQGTVESVTSAPTAAVGNVNDPGAVSIDNLSPVQGETLTASVSDADGASGAISYQWYRDGLAIGGATGASYTTVAADVGAVLTVRADYTDDQGTVESVTSAPTAAVIPHSNIGETSFNGDDAADPVSDNDSEGSETAAEPAEDPVENVADVIDPVVTSIPVEEGTAQPRKAQNMQLSAPVTAARFLSPTRAVGLFARDTIENASGKYQTTQKHEMGEKHSQWTNRGASIISLISARSYANMVQSLDSLKEEIFKENQLQKVYLGSAIVSSIGLSVGYVVWLIRGGMLLSTLLSSLPAWQILDPLPILVRKKDSDTSGDDESLESILDRRGKKTEPEENDTHSSPDHKEQKR